MVWEFVGLTMNTKKKTQYEDEEERIKYADLLLKAVVKEMKNTPRDKLPSKIIWPDGDAPTLEG